MSDPFQLFINVDAAFLPKGQNNYTSPRVTVIIFDNCFIIGTYVTGVTPAIMLECPGIFCCTTHHMFICLMSGIQKNPGMKLSKQIKGIHR